MNRIRVGVLDVQPLHEHGGISRVLRELIASWDPVMEVTFVTPQRSSWPVLRNYPTSMQLAGSPDLVYLPRTGGSMVLKNTRMPSVVTVHDVGFWDSPEDRRALGAQRFMVYPHFYALRYAQAIVTVSQFTKDRLTALFPELKDRTRVIPWGISRAFATWTGTPAESRASAEYFLQQWLGRPLLIYVGDDGLRKNLSLLLTAFRMTKTAFPKAQLIKVGRARSLQDQKRTHEMLRRLALKVPEDVLFVENVDDAQLATLYAAADLFVSASLYEGFGLPAVEALSVGTPTLVTQCAAFPEIVGEVAMLAEPTLDAFASAMIRMLQYPPGAGVRASAQRYVRSTYAWQRTARAYGDLFCQLVGALPTGQDMH
ncbi:MAG: glycosyltransferase family 1 protein [Firmicutes bacterium]|nr:glycosyltransferase family 1 protein [Bacillota bacterium]